MADIRVKEKEGPPAWLWIVGVLLLGAIIWALVSMLGRDDRAQEAVVTQPTAVGPAEGVARDTDGLPAATQSFVRECHVEEGRRTEEMGVEHEFAVRCFERLADALDEMAEEPGSPAEVDAQVRTIRQRATQIRESGAGSTQHANWSREAAEAGAAALAQLQQARHSGDASLRRRVEETRESATRITGSELQLEQLTHLRSFFRQAGDALRGMAQRTTA